MRCHSSPAVLRIENSQSPHLLFKTKTTPAAVSMSNAILGSSLTVTRSSRQIPLSRDLTPAEYLTPAAEEQSPNTLLLPKKHSPDFDARSVKAFYHVSEDPKIPQGYCIIINNNTQKYDDQTMKEMREVLSNRLGFHVQVYSSLTHKGIKHLL
ncbi:PREDICTED: uncharacterized protein LOC109586429 [Amphimedon queenslandica]|uniref:Uncharacterized protein n=1 Tax=Amphimedon queenslandica TaxID=400682 RepID=A0AAN0JN14_AMPQE|nr:PREDICTED: uncharacterized protein LOC109586429 [Amphimedon queenslandica]|eukprot:XP_019858172.1 PREDICTED: uncharacterized protein LOC109586429 [Amphimedon queenslandica]